MKTNYFSFFTKFNCVALLLALWFSSNTTNAQITTTIYPTNSSMNTGYVTSGGVKYSDAMQVSTSTTYGRGWAKFPLTSIPTGSTVTAATIEFYTFGGTVSSGVNSITGFTGDPVSMTGTTLYNTIGIGTSYNSSTWTIGTTTTPSLNSRALAGGAPFVQGQIGTGYVNFGFVRGSTNLHSVYGFSNTTYRVRLIVTYTLPACFGTPAAGTANVNGNTSIQVCDNSSFSLNCTGQATSTGITANWQIGASAAGPFSDISGASAATFSTSTTATRYYRYRVTCSNSGLSSYTNVLTVSYSTISNPTASNQTITCGQTATLTASGAPIGGDYMWYSDATGATQVGTGATFTTPSLSANTTYYVRSKLGLCNSALVPVTVTVNLAAGPTVTGTTLICGSGSTTLTATGSGNPIQWYSDAAATNLLGTGTTYTTPSLSANTTYYVRQGANIQTFSYTSPVTATYTTGGAVSITVPSTPTGASGNGTLTVYLIGDLDLSSETVDISSETGSVATGVYTGIQCSATYWSNTYSLTAANINSWAANGTINFNFQSTASVNNICTASAAFQVYVVLTYNYIISPCNSSLTPVTVTVNPTSVAGTASSNQTICSGSTASLTLAGQTGTIQWQQSANGTSGWSNVTTGTGGTTTSYTSAALSATTYYRAVVTSGVCSSVNSNVVTITVNPASVAGTAGSDQTICSGATAALTLTGQTGTIQWQQSANGTSGWSNVTTGTGATTTNYTSAALSATTYYRAGVTSGVCSSVNSNVVIITVNPTSVAGTAGSNQTICSGATVSITLTGQTGTIQWQQSANGTSGWSNVTTGTGATTTSYTSAALSATTYYRAVVTSGVCSSVNSNVVTVTVNPTSVAGTAGSDQTICYNQTASLTLTGQTGTIQWQQSANGTSGWSNVTTGTGATTANYTSAALSATTYYRAVVSSGVCSSVNSNVVTVIVNQPSVNPSSITGSLSICLGASTTLTAVGGTLGVGANYQWGTGSVVGTNPISGATSSTLSASPSSSTNYWVQIVNGTGPCSTTTAGLSTTITVNTPTLASNPTAGSAVWRGASSTDWTTASNWYAYDGTNYTVATATPTASSSVIIPANQGCVTQQPAVAISGTVNANNLTIETGAALTMGTSSVLNVAGNFTINGTGTFTPGTGTVNFTGNGTQVVTNGTQAFNNVTVSGFGTVQMTGNTTINGNFLNTDGTLDMNNFNLTVGGNYANYNSSSGLLPGTGTVIFNKASGTQTVDQLALDFNHIQHTGAGTLQLISDLSTTGDIINSAGTFDANDKIITVRNNFTNTATFTPGTVGLGEIYFEKIGGTQTLTSGGAVFQKFAHTGTGTLNLAGIVEVKGDVVIDAPISAGTSTLKLSGTGNQIMSGTQSVIALKDMTVAKTAGTVTLSKPVRVDGALTMTQGNIITSATSKLEIGSSTSALGSVNWTSGNVVGPMRRWFAGATNSTAASGMFPVGLSTVNRYAQVNFTQAPGSGGYIDMEYKAGLPANAANWTYVTTPDGQLIQTFEDEGYWDITPYDASGNAYPSGLNTSAFTMKLRANGLTSVNDITITRIIRSPGPLHTTWEPAGFHLAATGTSSDFAIESNTITGFSWFNIGSPNNNALPVELLNFNGTCEEGMVNLAWQTASEFNSSHFDVEKSTDGETWRVLTTVPSAGTSNDLLTYQAMDNNGTNGSNYYRLRQVDNDGKEKLYDPINVSCVETTAGYFTSYPNPSGNEFQVVVNNKEILGACTLNIVDAQGKVIDQRSIDMKEGINMFVISETLNPGIYFLNITNGTKTTQVIKHAVK